MTYGETDDFGYNVVENPVHVHDLHATFCTASGSITELTSDSRAGASA